MLRNLMSSSDKNDSNNYLFDNLILLTYSIKLLKIIYIFVNKMPINTI